MISWEFPPFVSGGLGTHTFEISRELAKKCHLTLLIPARGPATPIEGVEILYVPLKRIILAYEAKKDLIGDVENFNENAFNIAKNLDFDIIHCHDWLTIKAGIKLKNFKKKPLVFTVHSTEYDRTIGFPWDYIIDIEKQGLDEASKVITVSNVMKKQLVDNYQCSPEKINVIYNAVRAQEFENPKTKKIKIQESEKSFTQMFLSKLSREKEKSVNELQEYFKNFEKDIEKFYSKRKKVARIPKEEKSIPKTARKKKAVKKQRKAKHAKRKKKKA